MDSISSDRRRTVTDEEKKLLIGDELTTSSAALVKLCWPDNEQTPQIVSDFLAHLLGRAAALASSAVLGVFRPANARLDQMEIQQRTVGERLNALEGRQNTNTTRVGEFNLRLNGFSDQLYALLDQLGPEGSIAELERAMYRVATEMEEIKAQRQDRGDG